MNARAALIAPLLAGCGAEVARDAADPNAPKVACAKAGSELASVCIVDQVRDERGLILTIRHPDGAFRRLLVATDGRGVVAADGAEPARVDVIGADGIEVAVAGERYRLPATVQGGTAAP